MYVHTSAATEKTKVYIKAGYKYFSHAVLISSSGCDEACPEMCETKWSFNQHLFAYSFQCRNCPWETDNSLKLTCSKMQYFDTHNKYFTRGGIFYEIYLENESR